MKKKPLPKKCENTANYMVILISFSTLPHPPSVNFEDPLILSSSLKKGVHTMTMIWY